MVIVSAGFLTETWTFVIHQNQNALSGEFTSSSPDHSGTFSATLIGTALANVRMDFTTTCGGQMGSTNGKCKFALDPVTGTPQTMSLFDLSYADCHTTASTDIFSGLGAFQRTGPETAGRTIAPGHSAYAAYVSRNSLAPGTARVWTRRP